MSEEQKSEKSGKTNILESNADRLKREQRRINRLNSIKNELETGQIKNFQQIFAIMTETRLATELQISFYGFRKKTTHPGEFTLYEIIRFAGLLGVHFDVMNAFIVAQLKAKAKQNPIYRNV